LERHMSYPRLTTLAARNFRSLEDVKVPLGALTVLVGPNGSGKTNVLNVMRFLASTVRFDLAAAVGEWGGMPRISRQSAAKTSQSVTIQVSGQLTQHSSDSALDEYKLQFRSTPLGALTRSEDFTFKRTKGRGRRITVSGRHFEIGPEGPTSDGEPARRRLATAQTTGLSTLPRLADDEGGEGIRVLAEFLSSIRVLEPDMQEARRPSHMVPGRLADDAGNLASALHRLSTTDGEFFESLLGDMRYCLPGLDSIEFVPVGGPGRAVAVALRERGLSSPVELADASFGTVRLLALLTALHEPDPPPFTAIEEVDHGLHPYALDVLVDRLRQASRLSQIMVTTHSPTFVNRLKPSELVVCARNMETGASVIPYSDSRQLARVQHSSDLRLGELWFAGALGGVPDSVA